MLALQCSRNRNTCENATQTAFSTHFQNNSSKHELKSYTLFKTSRGHFYTKIHNCYVDALCQELFIPLLLLTPLMLLCMQHQRGTTANLL